MRKVDKQYLPKNMNDSFTFNFWRLLFNTEYINPFTELGFKFESFCYRKGYKQKHYVKTVKNKKIFVCVCGLSVSLKVDGKRIFKYRKFNNEKECAEFTNKILKQLGI